MNTSTINIIQSLQKQGDLAKISGANNTLKGEFSALLQQLFSGKSQPNLDGDIILNDTDLSNSSKKILDINNGQRSDSKEPIVLKNLTTKNLQLSKSENIDKTLATVLVQKVKRLLQSLEATPENKAVLQDWKAGEIELVFPVNITESRSTANDSNKSDTVGFLLVKQNAQQSQDKQISESAEINLLVPQQPASHLLATGIGDENEKTVINAKSDIRIFPFRNGKGKVSFGSIPASEIHGKSKSVGAVPNLKDGSDKFAEKVAGRNDQLNNSEKRLDGVHTTTKTVVPGETEKPNLHGEHSQQAKIIQSEKFTKSVNQKFTTTTQSIPEQPIGDEPIKSERQVVSDESGESQRVNKSLKTAPQWHALKVTDDVSSNFSRKEKSLSLGSVVESTKISQNHKDAFVDIAHVKNSDVQGSKKIAESKAQVLESVGSKINKSHSGSQVTYALRDEKFILMQVTNNAGSESETSSLGRKLSSLLNKMNGAMFVEKATTPITMRQSDVGPHKSVAENSTNQRFIHTATAGEQATKDIKPGVNTQSKAGSLESGFQNSEKAAFTVDKNKPTSVSKANTKSQTLVKPEPISVRNPDNIEIAKTPVAEKQDISSYRFVKKTQISSEQKQVFERILQNVDESTAKRAETPTNSKVNTPDYSTTRNPENSLRSSSGAGKINDFAVSSAQGAETSAGNNNSFDLGTALGGKQGLNQMFGGTNQTEGRQPVIQQVIDKIQSITQQIKANTVTQNAQNINAQIALKPAHLGTVLLSLRFQENLLHGTIFTSTHEAKHSVEKQMPAIRDAIQHQNVSLQDIKVEVRSDISQDNRQSFSDQFAREQAGSEHRKNGSSTGRSSTPAGFKTSHDELDPAVTTNTNQVTPGRIEYYA